MKKIIIDDREIKAIEDTDFIKKPRNKDCGMCGKANYDIDMVKLETFPKDKPKKEILLCKMCACNLKKMLAFIGYRYD